LENLWISDAEHLTYVAEVLHCVVLLILMGWSIVCCRLGEYIGVFGQR